MVVESDKNLIERIKAGDERAIEILVKKYYPRILTHIEIQIGKNKEVIHEIAHEAIIAIIEGIKTRFDVEKAKSLGSYIYGVTKHKIGDYFRNKDKNKKVIDTEYDLDTFIDSIEKEGKIKSEKYRSLIAQGIYSLKKSHRRVLYLRYYKGYNWSEIAEITNIPREKVKDVLHYCLTKLRKKIEKN